MYYMDPSIKAEADLKKKEQIEKENHLRTPPSVLDNLKSF